MLQAIKTVKQWKMISRVLSLPKVICLWRCEEATNKLEKETARQKSNHSTLPPTKKKGVTQMPKGHSDKVTRSQKLSHEMGTGCDTLKEPTEIRRWGRNRQLYSMLNSANHQSLATTPYSSLQGRPAYGSSQR